MQWKPGQVGLRRERPFKDALFPSCPLKLIPQDLDQS